MNTSWERLEQVIKTTGLSVNKFAAEIGLKRSENLYRIKKEKNAISKELAELITIKYCNISKSWLLTGEGSMITKKDTKNAKKADSKKIPFYDTILVDSDSQANMVLLDPSYYIDIPTLSNCDFAAPFVGESMSPEIPSGSIVTLKEISVSGILPGEIYLVVTKNYSTIKYIRTVSDNNLVLRLVPRNTEHYDESILEKSQIIRLFLVKGVISTKIL